MHWRKGVARLLLEHIKQTALDRGITTLLLETGTQPPFLPARNLYKQFGFVVCEPFAEYKPDPHSVFMRCKLAG